MISDENVMHVNNIYGIIHTQKNTNICEKLQ